MRTVRIDIKPRHRNSPRPCWKVAKAFSQWIRGRACACRGNNPDCGGPIESAHVDYAAKGTPDAKGTGTKVGDRWQIPLSRACHRLQHDKGWPWFDITILRQAGAGEQMARAYWRAFPGDKGDLANGE